VVDVARSPYRERHLSPLAAWIQPGGARPQRIRV
jgi:hypothetical protein